MGRKNCAATARINRGGISDSEHEDLSQVIETARTAIDRRGL